MSILLLLLPLAAPAQGGPRAETASAWLGFSGATLSIRSVDAPRRPGTARRALTLVMADVTRRRLRLADGGGHAGNHGLNLYRVEPDRFLLVSERDCVGIEPLRGALDRCRKAEACRGAGSYLGRFDWMNGFDPPRGRFRFAFRFLPAHDAPAQDGC